MGSGVFKYFVFDHQHGRLESLALEAGFELVGAQGSEEAFEVLTRSGEWGVAFVHIRSGPWKALCRDLLDDRILIRFSSEGFPPTPPQGLKVLALHCLKKTGDLELVDIVGLVDACRGVNVVDFRNGHIPANIRSLISFELPHRLRALHVLLQGVLASWASDPLHKSSQQALSLLGLDSVPVLPGGKIVQVRTLWRGLGLAIDGGISSESKQSFLDGILKELGASDLAVLPSSRDFIVHIFESRDLEEVDPRIALLAFEELDQFLCRR